MEKKKAVITSILYFEVSRDTAGINVNITLKCKVAFCPDDLASMGNGGKPYDISERHLTNRQIQSLKTLVIFEKEIENAFIKILKSY